MQCSPLAGGGGWGGVESMKNMWTGIMGLLPSWKRTVIKDQGSLGLSLSSEDGLIITSQSARALPMSNFDLQKARLLE